MALLYLVYLIVLLPCALAQTSRIEVNTMEDTDELLIENCLTGMGACNLRSAWTACNDNNSSSICHIDLSLTPLVEFNGSLGSLPLSPFAPSIEIMGSESILTCLDCQFPPTVIPSFPLTTDILYETASGTDRNRTAEISFEACFGDSLHFSTCDDTSMDTIIFLFDEKGSQVAMNDDSCGFASEIIYRVPAMGCQTFTLVMGCYGNSYCYMTMEGFISKPSDEIPFIEANISADAVRGLSIDSMEFRHFAAILRVQGDIEFSMSNCLFSSIASNIFPIFHFARIHRGRLNVSSSVFSNVQSADGLFLIEDSLVEMLFTDNHYEHCKSSSNGGVFQIHTHVHNLFLARNTFDACSAVGKGGVIYISSANSNFIVESCTFSDSYAGADGGAIYIKEGNLDILIKDSQFTKNEAEDVGGAIYVGDYNFNIAIISSQFNDGYAYYGGAISLNEANFNVTFNDVVFNKCESLFKGGAVDISEGNSYISFMHVNFYLCTSSYGGGVYLGTENRLIKWIDVAFESCSSASYAGAVYADSKNRDLVFQRAYFKSCSASVAGAIRLYVNNADVSFVDAHFEACQAVNGGGALQSVTATHNLSIDSSSFTNCSATDGAAFWVGYNHRNLAISNTMMTRCVAEGMGGAIFIEKDQWTVSLTNMTISNGMANEGGAIYMNEANIDVVMRGVNFVNNLAHNSGGAILADLHNRGLTFIECQFIENRAPAGEGGALYIGSNNSDMSIAGCLFQRNIALLGGGSVFLRDRNNHFLAMDSKGFEARQIIRIAPPPSSSESEEIYHLPEDCSSVIITFDPRSKIEPTYSYVAIVDDDDGWEETRFDTQDNTFPGDTIPSLLLKNVTTLKIIYQVGMLTPALQANKLFGILLTITPIIDMESSSKSPNPTTPTVFHNSVAYDGSGGAVFMYSSNNNVMVINSDFENNRALGKYGYGGAVYIWLGTTGFIFSSGLFANNSADVSGGALTTIAGNAGGLITDCVFENNSAGAEGGSLFMGTSNGEGMFSYLNELYITDTSFLQCTAQIGGAMSIDSRNNVRAIGVHIEDNRAWGMYGGGVHLNSLNVFVLQSSTVIRNRAGQQGGGIYSAAENELTFNEVLLVSNEAGSLGGGLCLRSQSELVILGYVLLENNAATFGGGGIALLNCPLWQLEGDAGTALIFERNQAGRGAALYFFRLSPNEIALNNITMQDNIASVGGTVFWVYEKGYMEEEPSGLQASTVHFIDNKYGYGEVVTQGLSLMSPGSYQVTRYASALVPAIMVSIADFYGQKVISSNETTIQVAVDEASRLQFSCGTSIASLAGDDRFGSGVVVTNGEATFNQLLAYCTPNGSMRIRYDASLVSAPGAPSDVIDLFALRNYSQFRFRACYAGEFVRDGNCVVCQNGTFNLHSERLECSSCVGLAGAMNCYGSQIVVDEGYWRRFTTNSAILPCRLPYSCAGGVQTGDQSCAEGYEGPLCSLCSDGYYMTDTECLACGESNNLGITALLFILVFSLLVGSIILYYLYKRVYVDAELIRQVEEAIANNTEGPHLTSLQMVYLYLRKKVVDLTIKAKIIASTYQVVTTCTVVLNVSMPKSFNRFTSAFQFMNLDWYSLLPVGCEQQFNFMDELLWTTVAPLLVVGALMLVLVLSNLRYQCSNKTVESKQQWERIRERMFLSFFYLTYLVLPAVSVTIFQTFICQNVDPDQEDPLEEDWYLVADMSISCTSDYYKNWFVYAVMMVFVYPIGIPLIYFVMLYQSREAIMTRDDPAPEEGQMGSERQPAVVVEVARDKEENEGEVDVSNNMEGKQLGTRSVEVVSMDESPRVSEQTGNDGYGLADEDYEQLRKYRMKRAERLSFLWAAYEPQFWYWEIVEATRKIILTAVLSVVAPGTSSQNILSILLSLLFIKLYGYYQPYVEDNDDALAELGQFQIFFTYLAATTQQNDLLPTSYDNSLSAVLILINISLPALALYFEMKSFREDQRQAKARALMNADRTAEKWGLPTPSSKSELPDIVQRINPFRARGRYGSHVRDPHAYHVGRDQAAEMNFQLAVSLRERQRAHLAMMSELDSFAPVEDIEMVGAEVCAERGREAVEREWVDSDDEAPIR